MSIRPARPEDAAYVLGVRNRPEMRAASLYTHEITAEEHASWWDAGGREQTWVIEASCDVNVGDICPAGYVRVSPQGVVSIAVAPWARGIGVAKQALRDVQAHHHDLSAIVRADNEPSKRLFVRCGFVITATSGGIITYGWLRGN